MSLKPIGNILVIKLLKNNENGFVSFDAEGNKKKTLNYAIVIAKGDDCKKSYAEGDKIFFIADQEFLVKEDVCLLFDDDVLGVCDE